MSNVMDSLTAYLEKHVLPIANKLSTQRHLHAIRDAFISLVPVTLFGGICTILSSAPAVEPGSNFLLEAWANFAAANSTLLTWANTMTMGALSVYIALGVTYFLCKHYKIDAFIPLVLTMGGFLLICFGPVELGWDAKTADILYLDGKGLLVAIFLSILTVEGYRAMREHNVGRIALPPSVPASLSEAFASLIPGIIILLLVIVLAADAVRNSGSKESQEAETEQSTSDTGSEDSSSEENESDASSSLSTDTSLTVEDGDTVNIDYVGTIDGVEFDGGSTNGQGTDLVIGSGSYIDDFEEQLIGAHPGDTVDVNVTFPENYGVEDLNGQDAVFEVTVNGIYQNAE